MSAYRVHRVLRGGSYINDSSYLRTTDRDWCEPERRFRKIGFRIVIVRRRKK